MILTIDGQIFLCVMPLSMTFQYPILPKMELYISPILAVGIRWVVFGWFFFVSVMSVRSAKNFSPLSHRVSCKSNISYAVKTKNGNKRNFDQILQECILFFQNDSHLIIISKHLKTASLYSSLINLRSMLFSSVVVLLIYVLASFLKNS